MNEEMAEERLRFFFFHHHHPLSFALLIISLHLEMNFDVLFNGSRLTDVFVLSF